MGSMGSMGSMGLDRYRFYKKQSYRKVECLAIRSQLKPPRKLKHILFVRFAIKKDWLNSLQLLEVENATPVRLKQND